MIKITILRNKQKQFQQRILNLRTKHLYQELSLQNFNLSDQNCCFIINQNICLKSKFIAIQINVRPLVGLYENIDFVLTAFFDQNGNINAPKIYNDRRIFHPNINPFNLEVIVPQIVDWNPANSLTYILRRLKYTLIQPNESSIPNNHLCRKAAYLYKIDRANFRKYVIQYCPKVLEDIVLRQSQLSEDAMQQERPEQKQYIHINDIFPGSRLKQYSQITRADETFDFLNKRMSKMKLQNFEDTSQQESIFSNLSSNQYDDYFMQSQ